MAAKPRIADVRCTAMRFQDGDRILVRTYQPVDEEQVKKLTRMVRKWAGAEVEVLVINGLQLEIQPENKCLVRRA